MATKVTKITDENNPGFGFFAVDGQAGYYTEEVANRVAKQCDDAVAQNAAFAATASRVTPPPQTGVGTTACPSCGHTFRVPALADALLANAALQAKIDAAATPPAPTPPPTP